MRAEERGRARVLIVDDHELVREGLRAMLEHAPDLEIVGEAASGQQAVQACGRLAPDVVLMDIRMPDMTGLEATRAICQAHPDVRVLIVTTYDDPDYLLEALEAGAAGYVLKDASRTELTNAIRRVLRHEVSVTADLSGRLVRQLARQRVAERTMPVERLTPREHEVLQLMSEGRSNPEIAEQLIIGRGTVKGYVENIIRKLGVADRTQAAVKGLQLGLVRVGAGPTR